MPSNLPSPLTSFIGRQREIEEVKRLLATARLLTLTGAGGSGKSRLAFYVGAEVLPAYADGVWAVEFASLPDPRLVPQTAATGDVDCNVVSAQPRSNGAIATQKIAASRIERCSFPGGPSSEAARPTRLRTTMSPEKPNATLSIAVARNEVLVHRAATQATCHVV